MNRLRHISAIAAAAFAASLSFSLIACDDSSSASNEEVPNSSDSGAALGSSGSVPAGMEGLPQDVLVIYSIHPACGDGFHPEGSCTSITEADGKAYLFECVGTKWEYNQDCEEPKCLTAVSKAEHPECQFPECNAESEGVLDSSWSGNNPKYGEMMYYRCESGSWVERDQWVTCDMEGVAKGDTCRKIEHKGFFYQYPKERVFVYEGDGTWNKVDCPTEPEKECNEENKGTKEKLTSTNSTEFFRCSGSKWIEIDYAEYYCSTGKETFGDTCSLEIYDERYYFRYDSISENYAKWVDAVFDPELGFCTATDYWTYAQKGGKYYYCVGSEWRPASLVPRQYTDPRKEGLTDEEYDVLDLPKDAKVGDRANGLLEYCNYDIFLESPSATVDTYDYCFSPNHYRYREDGSWTAETPDETREDEIDLDSLPCGGSTWCCAETEGMKRRIFEGFDEPERVYQCVSGEIKLVEYLWNRYEKK
ncbi:hypothetical protein [uncultured Fibrobacter sp.]|uniref:hypothetical protein n=1 Tax=uncultured Fibrobacter sp. TaxID=261512 RepID=UPI0025FCD571|nr:hypothetical protein [uncultured Fibrobacter sp.]